MTTPDYTVCEFHYYRRTLSSIYRTVQTVDGSHRLPIVNKETIIENMDEILCAPQAGDLLSFTSDITTSVKPFIVRHTSNYSQISLQKWKQTCAAPCYL